KLLKEREGVVRTHGLLRFSGGGRAHSPPKSIHMTFVHSCSALGVFLSSYSLDRGGDLWILIELGEMVSPGAIRLHVPFDVLHQITQAFPCVVPCALVMDIAERLMCQHFSGHRLSLVFNACS